MRVRVQKQGRYVKTGIEIYIHETELIYCLGLLR